VVLDGAIDAGLAERAAADAALLQQEGYMQAGVRGMRAAAGARQSSKRGTRPAWMAQAPHTDHRTASRSEGTFTSNLKVADV